MCSTYPLINVHFKNLQSSERFDSFTQHYYQELSCSLLQLQLDLNCSWFCPAVDLSYGGWIRVVTDSILRLDTISSWFHTALTQVWRLDTSCYWFHLVPDSSSSGCILVATDLILWLTRVWAVGYELWLTPSCGWLEFRWLHTNWGWDILLTQVPAAGNELRLTRVPVDGYDLQLILSYGWLELRWLDSACGWLIPLHT